MEFYSKNITMGSLLYFNATSQKPSFLLHLSKALMMCQNYIIKKNMLTYGAQFIKMSGCDQLLAWFVKERTTSIKGITILGEWLPKKGKQDLTSNWFEANRHIFFYRKRKFVKSHQTNKQLQPKQTRRFKETLKKAGKNRKNKFKKMIWSDQTQDS